VKAFWLDHDHGRYAERVRFERDQFADTVDDISPVAFACVAWRLASTPSLGPSYVGRHRFVLTAECVRNEWDGSLVARLDLVAPPPAPLSASRAWQQDRGWRGWPELFGQFVEPTERDLAHHPHLRTTLRIEAPLPLAGLPPAPESLDGDLLVEAAMLAVTAQVRELNELVGPVVAQLETVPNP
jgi:hypothetical protein